MEKFIFKYGKPFDNSMLEELKTNPHAVIVCSNCYAMSTNIYSQSYGIIKEHIDGEIFKVDTKEYLTGLLEDFIVSIEGYECESKKFSIKVISPSDALELIESPYIYTDGIDGCCPCCGKRYDNNDSYRILDKHCSKEFFISHIDLLGSMDSSKLSGYFSKISQAKYDAVIENCKNESLEMTCTVHTTTDIPKYIKALIDVESNICFLERRIKELCLNSILIYRGRSILAFGDDFEDMCKRVIKTQADSAIELASNKAELLAQIKLIEDSMIFSEKNINYETYGLVKPNPPEREYMVCPVKPTEPIYRKPGLLNKSKIQCENDKIKSDYLAAIKEYEDKKLEWDKKTLEYETAKEKYQKDLDAYNNDCKLLVEDEKRRFEESDIIEQSKFKIAELRNEIEKIEISLQNLNVFENKKYLSTSEKIAVDSANYELNVAIESLKNAYVAKNNLLSMNLIFDKYINLAALSSIYEYFQAGRVSELSGPQGAYNLYENELRANLIIDKLDQVIKGLDDIKRNQYMLYQEMCNINNNLNTLEENSTKLLGEIRNNTEVTARNSAIIAENSAVVAYNSGVSAFYAQKNSELINSLGYLIAIG